MKNERIAELLSRKMRSDVTNDKGVARLMRRALDSPSAPAARSSGAGTQYLTVFIDDVDAHFRQAEATGAKILEEPHETVDV
jgi:uncharacterized glyoxalase superfamily protein PhnB